jgi:hypothetical protein
MSEESKNGERVEAAMVSFREVSSQQFSQPNDPLISLLFSSQIDRIYQDTTFTQSQSCSQGLESCSSGATPEIIPPVESATKGLVNELNPSPAHSRLAETAKRLNDFAESLLDPVNEGDPFFQTVLKIYRFFGHKFSMLGILSALHSCAGDVEKTVAQLSETHPDHLPEDDTFDFKTLNCDQETTVRYFRF